MTSTVRGVQAIIGYTFNNPDFVWEAVTAAGSLKPSGGRHYPNGHKRLAIVGDTLLQLVLAEDWHAGTEPRAAFDTVRQRVASNVNLNSIGRTSGLDTFVILAGGSVSVPPIAMTATVEAIVGAVWLDSSNIHSVRAVMQRLGLI